MITLPDQAVEISHLSKTYGGQNGRPAKLALDDVSLSIPRGAFFGLLGPNGAGKSTLINILAGLVKKSSGTAHVWGHDIDRAERLARLSIGVVPQELNLDPFFTPFEMLEVQAGLYGVAKAKRHTQEILAAMGLSDKAHSYARTLSGGMRRRLLVGKALVHSPPVLVLDEPTAGVDIELRRNLWDYVRALNAAGTTILLTTHYLEEAEELCDRIAIIDRGRLIACDEKQVLMQRLDRKALTLTLTRPLMAIPETLAQFAPELKANGQKLYFRFRPSATGVGRILDVVRDCGLEIADLTTDEADLEDVFLALTHAARMEKLDTDEHG
ncbi:MAG: ABC transporter ATP-binding protein [Rhodospirillales bacterium]|nr:MAG: ABC transporter ATP-binding protein [Rhodospirillales bacterium]